MLVAISKYLKSLEQVDAFRKEHHAYLKPFFSEGKLLACGRQTTNAGGVIIANNISKKEFAAILHDDPFVRASVTRYQIHEFTLSFCHEAVADFFED